MHVLWFIYMVKGQFMVSPSLLIVNHLAVELRSSGLAASTFSP